MRKSRPTGSKVDIFALYSYNSSTASKAGIPASAIAATLAAPLVAGVVVLAASAVLLVMFAVAFAVALRAFAVALPLAVALPPKASATVAFLVLFFPESAVNVSR